MLFTPLHSHDVPESMYGMKLTPTSSRSFRALQFGRSRGLTVNSVASGPVVTDEQIKFASSPEGERFINHMIGRTRAADRLGEIADAVLLVVQEKTRFITGRYIDVSGGVTDL